MSVTPRQSPAYARPGRMAKGNKRRRHLAAKKMRKIRRREGE